jgi:hypothetical protein
MSRENTRLIFQILSEMTERAKLGLDFETLNALIELAGMTQFAKMGKALGTRKSMIVAVADGIEELLEDLDRKLTGIKGTVEEEMNSTGEANFAELVVHLMQIPASGEKLAFFSQNTEHVRRPVDLVLICVCFVEFIAYVVFIYVRRRQTRGFKLD